MLVAMMSRALSGLTATVIYLHALLYTYFSHVLVCSALLYNVSTVTLMLDLNIDLITRTAVALV